MAITSPESSLTGDHNEGSLSGIDPENDLNVLLARFDPDAPELDQTETLESLAGYGVDKTLAEVFTAGRCAAESFTGLDNLMPPKHGRLDIVFDDTILPASDPDSCSVRISDFRHDLGSRCKKKGIGEVAAYALTIVSVEGVTNKWRNAPNTRGRLTIGILLDDPGKAVFEIENTVIDEDEPQAPLAISEKAASETGYGIQYSDDAEHGRGIQVCKGYTDGRLYRYGKGRDSTLWGIVSLAA